MKVVDNRGEVKKGLAFGDLTEGDAFYRAEEPNGDLFIAADDGMGFCPADGSYDDTFDSETLVIQANAKIIVKD